MNALSFAAGILAAALAVLPARAGQAPQPEAVRSVMRHVVDDVVRPGYRAFEEKARAFKTATESLCEKPGRPARDGARAAFVDLVRAWGTVDALQFGPIKDENRSERILFYPDPKGIGQRQVQAILASKDAAAADPKTLAKKSVAVQGLTAADLVLFGTGSGALADAKAGAFRCRYAAAIAGNVASIAHDVRSAWDEPAGVAKNWENAGLKGSAFDEPGEALFDVLSALMHGLEEVNDVWIASFFADTPSKDTPNRAIFRRSAATMPLIAADLEGMRTLFQDGQMASVLPRPKGAVARLIDNGFDRAVGEARAIREPLVKTMADIPNRQKFVALTGVVAELKNTLGNDYGPAIGMSTGFSFADGD
ncbi:MAG: imelysin family protein [Pararhizobium sp.]